MNKKFLTLQCLLSQLKHINQLSPSFEACHLSFQICMEPIYSCTLYHTNTVLLSLLGITIVGSDNRESSLYLPL